MATLDEHGRVSIHAPAWGATSTLATFISCTPEFQSTHPRGVRHTPSRSRRFEEYVSIHAPAWGATRKRPSPHRTPWGFQSTHPRGVRQHPSGAMASSIQFQSTHPRGVRPEPDTKGAAVAGFNPRTRVGCDRGFRCVRDTPGVSIHAPAWGATRRAGLGMSLKTCFNPRTRVGCDVRFLLSFNLRYWFQSTHPRGVRRAKMSEMRDKVMFQSTHPRGVRLVDTTRQALPTGVSIHAPAWGATCGRD